MTDSKTYQGQAALPIGEVARMLGVSVGTLRNWEKSGKIATFRTPGGQRRFRAEDVEALRSGTALAEGGDAA
ncbi:MerR family DNA-binding transcriptional regulator [Microcella sp.]|uniref:MerR family DNA-binding transcriptional regulator n=1 Tax=Microcella sp. TaxID=1913979 RepID=UPI00391C8BFE